MLNILKSFRVRNFLSYRGTTTLSTLSSSEIIGYRETIKLRQSECYNRHIAFYGNMGSGKSNILRAIAVLRYIVSYTILNKYELNSQLGIGRWIEAGGSLGFGQGRENPTEFHIEYVNNGYEYKYSLLWSNLEGEDHGILSEKLEYREYGGYTFQNLFGLGANYITVFNRAGSNYNLGIAEISQGHGAELCLDNHTPLISYLYKNHSSNIIKYAVDWFLNLGYMEYKDEQAYLDIDELSVNIFDPNIKRKMISYIKHFDFDISDFKVMGNEIVFIGRIRNGYKSVEFSYGEMSHGFQIVFSFLVQLFRSIQTKTPIIIDNFGRSLHPNLFDYILKLPYDLANSKYGECGQYIFSTDKQGIIGDLKVISRPDSLRIVRKDSEGVSNIYRLSELSDYSNMSRQDIYKFAQDTGKYFI